MAKGNIYYFWVLFFRKTNQDLTN